MNIEIITSRNSKLKETGFGSLHACDDVLGSIEGMGHSVLVTICETLEDLENVVRRAPDMVVLAAKYMPVEGRDDMWFSDYFEQNHITFSGSNRETLRYDSDKVSAKERLTNLGIKTAKYFTAIPDQYQSEEELPILFPLFLKPLDAANGNGVDDSSFVESFSEFREKVLSLYEIYKQPVLVEEYLSGREFTVAVIKNGSGKITISAIEIAPPESSGGLKILGAAAKMSDTETLKKIEPHDIASVNALAVASFQGLGARGFGRIDVKMDGLGVCYFMEANLVPGMNHGTSYFPRACEIENKISYDDVIKLILDESFKRVGVEREYNKKLR
ncbi:hypothetical protein [uncultured Neptuniibacter sp.]|uniref:hypothetical protein n=1 Tax=uncultured Neptuniibacter sp. TaxID=502143 RepID=UPI002631E5D1|nr:hypothetical protein [uncultured Neptuniibacter sp.]